MITEALAREILGKTLDESLKILYAGQSALPTNVNTYVVIFQASSLLWDKYMPKNDERKGNFLRKLVPSLQANGVVLETWSEQSQAKLEAQKDLLIKSVTQSMDIPLINGIADLKNNAGSLMGLARDQLIKKVLG